MEKIYSLLRNNKQTGPYTLEQLIGLSLKSTDLVWIEGRSAGWKNPGEIETLKLYVTDACIESNTDKEQFISSAKEQPALVNAIIEKQHVVQQKDTHIFVSLPAGAPVTPITDAAPSFDERLQKLQQKIASVSAAPSDVPDEESTVKYTRSLEDIKEEYSGWLQAQKKKRPAKKQWLPLAGGGIVILLFAFYLLPAKKIDNTSNDSTSTVTPSFAAQEIKQDENKIPPAIESNTSENIKNVLAKDVEKQTLNEDRTNEKTEPVTKESITKKAIDYDVHKPQQEVVINNKEDEKVKDDDNINNESSKETAAKNVPLTDLLYLDGKQTNSDKKNELTNYSITLQNNSDQLLKVVAVDVSYYNTASDLIMKKTVYFSNVKPGTSATIEAPVNKKAVAASCQLGLVSSEKGLYYAKQ